MIVTHTHLTLNPILSNDYYMFRLPSEYEIIPCLIAKPLCTGIVFYSTQDGSTEIYLMGSDGDNWTRPTLKGIGENWTFSTLTGNTLGLDTIGRMRITGRCI